MTITRDVILDMLPLYFAGQVSADTKALVDDFLKRDPDFARMSQRFDELLAARGAGEQQRDEVERRAFQRTRTLLRYRNQMIGFAVGYSLAPFLFLFRGGHVEWIMFRDKPGMAIGFALVAVLCWIAVALLGMRSKSRFTGGITEGR